jgi:SAM-dependent methyltransferase
MSPAVQRPEPVDFSLLAHDYDTVIPYFRTLASHLVRTAPPDGLTLDVGTGKGAVLASVAPSHRCIGVDRNLDMIVAGQPGARVPFVQALAEGLPFRDQTFNTVYMCALLRFVGDPVGVLGEAWRVACPGSTIAIAEPHQRDPRWTFLAALLQRELRAAGVWRASRRFTVEETCHWLGEVGFTDVRCRWVEESFIFRDVDQWWSWCMTLNIRLLVDLLPVTRREAVAALARDRARRLLGPDGLVMPQTVALVTGHRQARPRET